NINSNNDDVNEDNESLLNNDNNNESLLDNNIYENIKLYNNNSLSYLSKLIDRQNDLIKLLNDNNQYFTFFAPSNQALLKNDYLLKNESHINNFINYHLISVLVPPKSFSETISSLSSTSKFHSSLKKPSLSNLIDSLTNITVFITIDDDNSSSSTSSKYHIISNQIIYSNDFKNHSIIETLDRNHLRVFIYNNEFNADHNLIIGATLGAISSAIVVTTANITERVP
ncbi:9059_t:CDS:2, partial [Entrophospora sp. SA101]